jgi:hypothetical protein
MFFLNNYQFVALNQLLIQYHVLIGVTNKKNVLRRYAPVSCFFFGGQRMLMIYLQNGDLINPNPFLFWVLMDEGTGRLIVFWTFGFEYQVWMIHRYAWKYHLSLGCAVQAVRRPSAPKRFVGIHRCRKAIVAAISGNNKLNWLLTKTFRPWNIVAGIWSQFSNALLPGTGCMIPVRVQSTCDSHSCIERHGRFTWCLKELAFIPRRIDSIWDVITPFDMR